MPNQGTGQGVIPLQRSMSRVWMLRGRARPDHQPSYKSHVAAGALDRPSGDITPIWQPGFSNYKKFLKVGSFRGSEDNPSMPIVANFPASMKSEILEMVNEGCPFDIQLHMGDCEDPTSYNAGYQKILILEEALYSNYSTDELGTRAPDDESFVTETGELSAERVYEFGPLVLSERKPAAVTNELLDVVICDTASCGDCTVESNGCQRIYAISKAAGGSPSTPADVVFSVDGGLNWLAHDIDTLGAAVDPDEIDCVGDYVVVLSEADNAFHIALKSEFTATSDPAFTRITTGIVVGAGPRAIYSLGNTAFIGGAQGYIYKMTNAPSGVIVLDAGDATISQINAVHATSEQFAVAVGNDGVIILIQNDVVSLLATPPVGVGVNINTVFLKNDTEWFIGTDDGQIFYTLDSGLTWTEKLLPGTTPSAITFIEMATESIMYVSATVSSNGKLFLSTDGGNNFDHLPRVSSGAIPINDRINALATCPEDPDFVVGVGLADDAVDGYLVVGQDQAGTI